MRIDDAFIYRSWTLAINAVNMVSKTFFEYNIIAIFLSLFIFLLNSFIIA